MRKTLKILHTLAACGMIGGLLVYMLLLVEARQDTPEAYADLRWSISQLSDYVLMPSLAIVVVSGLLAMVVHRPYMDKRWAWVKAASGILMFKGVLTIVGAKANYAAGVAEKIANGEASREALDAALAYEWYALGAILALSVANVILGVWRPKLKVGEEPRARRAPQAPAKSEAVAVEDERIRPAA